MITEFLKYIKYERNYSQHTIKSYENDLYQFAEFNNQNAEQFEYTKITTKDIQAWIIALMNKKINPRSIARKISCLKAFWRYIRTHKNNTANPTLKIVLPKTKKEIPTFFRTEEINNAINTSQSPENFETLQKNLILKMLFLTGIRRSEITNLKEDNIDGNNLSIKIKGKRNKERNIPISKEFHDEILLFIKHKNETIERTHNYLYTLKNGKPIYSEYIYKVVTEKMKLVTSNTRKSPHTFRHTFATTLLNNGADINAVKELLGHKSLATTQIYTHTSFDELYNIYKHTHPRGN